MRPQNYHINRLIQDINADASVRSEFRADPHAFFETYRVTTQQQQLLSDGSIEAMTELGVHPNLQMKWLLLQPGATRSGPGPLSAYLPRLLGEE